MSGRVRKFVYQWGLASRNLYRAVEVQLHDGTFLQTHAVVGEEARNRANARPRRAGFVARGRFPRSSFNRPVWVRLFYTMFSRNAGY